MQYLYPYIPPFSTPFNFPIIDSNVTQLKFIMTKGSSP
ncbi:hypothetical protein LD85_2449 [Saccharolobus islandicus L.D.8.5]|uniref:Uncharacterized protein n=1 Tax=Saccharolobus islandicus (strain L.D.8.5 / Lassen \|nr:hypothetical protein LD85_2449 [Sulfolobus islandicus L.D.8.5]